MAEAAALVEQAYAPDFLDINFGCPVKKVVSRNGGSGCLRDLDLVESIIRAVAGAISIPTTVKIRSGWSEETRDPVGIGLRCQDAGARVLTLHARSRTQMYGGAANWDEIAATVARWTSRWWAMATSGRLPTRCACGSTPAVPAS
jgi:tRNA-dihydrouridine synthase B